MRARKDGLIINISSWAGRYASVLTGPAYNATKRAVIAVTESINMEECMNGIRATSILPGEVATPIMEKRPVPPTPRERRAWRSRRTSAPRSCSSRRCRRDLRERGRHRADLEPVLRRRPGNSEALSSSATRRRSNRWPDIRRFAASLPTR
jgi:NAD(P)-dependent dehydrogenase (short-subunit alcohol dehydrogenase family)